MLIQQTKRYLKWDENCFQQHNKYLHIFTKLYKFTTLQLKYV